MKLFLIAVSLLGANVAFAQEGCNCLSYPFKPDRCVLVCSANLLSKAVTNAESGDVLQRLGYGTVQIEELKKTEGDVGKIKNLLSANDDIKRQLDAGLEALNDDVRSRVAEMKEFKALKEKGTR